MKRIIPLGNPSTFWIAVAALLVGYALGQAGAIGGTGTAHADQGVPATPGGSAAVCPATPAAAHGATPAVSASPTPAPPAAAGQPVPYADDWTVTVTALSLMPSIGSTAAEGTFALVAMTIVNDGVSDRNFRFSELRLRDAAGRVVRSSSEYVGTFWTTRFVPGVPQDVVVAFDVARDAGEVFVVESTADPAFRVQIAVSRLG